MKLNTSKGANVNYLAEIVHVDKFSTHPNTSIEDVVNVNRNLVDLSKIWHDAKEEPEKGKLMIGIDEDGVSVYQWVGQDICGWLSFAECNGLIRWAYVDDLLPKGGGK